MSQESRNPIRTGANFIVSIVAGILSSVVGDVVLDMLRPPAQSSSQGFGAQSAEPAASAGFSLSTTALIVGVVVALVVFALLWLRSRRRRA